MSGDKINTFDRLGSTAPDCLGVNMVSIRPGINTAVRRGDSVISPTRTTTDGSAGATDGCVPSPYSTKLTSLSPACLLLVRDTVVCLPRLRIFGQSLAVYCHRRRKSSRRLLGL
jgi:hypothetical protein